jgi:hypothetical protein
MVRMIGLTLDSLKDLNSPTRLSGRPDTETTKKIMRLDSDEKLPAALANKPVRFRERVMIQRQRHRVFSDDLCDIAKVLLMAFKGRLMGKSCSRTNGL